MTVEIPLNHSEPMRAASMILPGATIGMVGGGQLGRMFAMAASSMGYEVVVFSEAADTPAAQVAHRCVVGRLDDVKAVEEFAGQCDVITLEFENIPADTIALCGKFAPTYPSASVLATAQDRLAEKTSLRDAGLPVTPMGRVEDRETLLSVADDLGWPLIVKTAHSGYDGKGQVRVESGDAADEVPWQDCDRWIAEMCIDFDREVSVVVARTVEGQKMAFPVFENSHRNHILDVTVAPAAISTMLADRAVEVAYAAADHLDVVGLLCVEFFVRGEELMINEVAPRPHNSGHLTIEGCETSQFEQHVRAICNLPLGSTALRSPAAAMVNLLGDLWPVDGTSPPWDRALRDRSACLHLYGKETAKVGRKMGHLTMTGDHVDDLRRRLLNSRAALQSEQRT